MEEYIKCCVCNKEVQCEHDVDNESGKVHESKCDCLPNAGIVLESKSVHLNCLMDRIDKILEKKEDKK